MIQMIIEIDEGADFEAMPEELQKAIQTLSLQWPQAKMIGTKAVNGKQLILVLSKVNAERLTEAMNGDYISGTDEQGNAVIINFNLGWSVLAEEGKPIDQAPLLPYFEPELSVSEDESGDIVTESFPVADLTGKLQTYAGKKWAY